VWAWEFGASFVDTWSSRDRGVVAMTTTQKKGLTLSSLSASAMTLSSATHEGFPAQLYVKQVEMMRFSSNCFPPKDSKSHSKSHTLAPVMIVTGLLPET
jgi:hypothetical protein